MKYPHITVTEPSQNVFIVQTAIVKQMRKSGISEINITDFRIDVMSVAPSKFRHQCTQWVNLT